MVQAGGGGVMMLGIFSWLIWAPTAASLPAYCCRPFPSLYDHNAPIILMEAFQQDNVPCHKAYIISDWFLVHDNEFTVLQWPPQSPDLNPVEHLLDVVEHHRCAADKSTTTAW